MIRGIHPKGLARQLIQHVRLNRKFPAVEWRFLWRQYRRCRQSVARIRALKNTHRGETIFCLGNGPSLRNQDLSALTGKTVLLTNRAHQLLNRFTPGTGYHVVIDRDAFNWGYDPVHYGLPEGSYGTAAGGEGAARVLEFRQMAQGLADIGLHLAMDVVYNHTFASGLNAHSVLDKIVPGYYHRLHPISGAFLHHSPLLRRPPASLT